MGVLGRTLLHLPARALVTWQLVMLPMWFWQCLPVSAMRQRALAAASLKLGLQAGFCASLFRYTGHCSHLS